LTLFLIGGSRKERKRFFFFSWREKDLAASDVTGIRVEEEIHGAARLLSLQTPGEKI
jgi:hypothetical protein